MPKQVTSLQGYDQLLLESIDEGLEALGENSKAVFYRLLDSSFDMKKSEIAFRTDEFYDILERVFGPGAPKLQQLFNKKLDEKIGNPCIVVQLSDFFAVHSALAKEAKCKP